MCIQRKHQIPQAFAVGKLTEHHAQQLVPACEMLDILIATVFLDDRVKHTPRKKIRQLCENVFALIHVKPLFAVNLNKFKSSRSKNYYNNQIIK